MSNPRQSDFRKHLIDIVAQETGATDARASEIVSAILSGMVEYITEHESTEIRGFGSFRWVLRRARKFKGGLFGARTVPAYYHLAFRTKAVRKARKNAR